MFVRCPPATASAVNTPGRNRTATYVPSQVGNCAVTPEYLRSAISFSRTYNIPNLISYIPHSPFNALLVVRPHGCAIACSLKQTFAQCKIFLEGTRTATQVTASYDFDNMLNVVLFCHLVHSL